MKVRRPEFKRKRSYRQRERKRNPMSRTLKGVYRSLYDNIMASLRLQTATPLVSIMQRAGEAKPLVWGGTGAYWDFALSGPTTTQATPRKRDGHLDRTGAAPVNYGDAGRAPSPAPL